ncbi:GntR family transcriptional regulator/MocR family aminotransferase [Pseudomonas sp. PvR086]|jgi:GntR family transcriptional regulator/MocR family aminotransferase|uniref:MocR-like pyridoxine biosynthesis transcription factor PdxR n=1 Tax=Pseudomonas TaxID=286 RepID=UPI00039C4EAE|nr:MULTISPECIES: PLP-dependent aminotransferase family protein [Pseudomonas]ANI63355.1 GntR family transcriptional regulator [Pseudomonas sp. GR 6-02]MBD9608792.1 PLP-dependent aminotransferase family protein [Pseudomonas sp. PDM08]PMY48608.1 PLP-dependent aminotransferase family protein [Pseudomonas sp. FW305-53]PMY88024.1 PLP-dependent aminotransferase family protein [Pseudomonas sp. FW303-C2]PMY93028.1 PLP-dependent aminotransferase family protein [Pseudomonas sp. FW305-62]
MSNTPLPSSFNPAGIELDRRQGLSRQLYQALRVRVLDGRLASGTRLPASRDLATALSISRNSVVRAYDQLYAEGFIEGRVGDGTYVAQLPQAALPAKKLSTKVSTGFSTGLPTTLSTNWLDLPVVPSSKVIHSSALGRVEKNHLAVPPGGPPRAFRVGVPAFDLFPFEVWAKLNAAFWRKPDLQQLCYGDPAGDERLRGLIAAYLRSSRGMQCAAEQIVITSGAQQGISLCAQLLVEPGDGVGIENPGYRAAGHAFAVAGAQLHGVPVDEEGIDCSALAQLSDCRLAYVTPSHQYPTGVVMSLARRLELLAWAEGNQGWIIEDDYDGEYRYSGAPLAPLAALDRHGRVLYVGTFGKVAFPALRLGYLVLPPGLVDAFAQRRAVDVRHSEVSTQAVMAEFMAAGHFQRHIRRMRRAALSRRNCLLGGWPAGMTGVGSLPTVSAGLHMTVSVDSLARERRLIEQAESVGVEINGLSNYWLPDSRTPVDQRAGLVLGFAAVPEPAIESALARLRQVWRD